MHIPDKLCRGDTIGVIAPSGPLNDEKKLNEALAFLIETGFKIKEGRFLRAKNRYLAGRDEQRLYDLHNMFSDETVKAVFCLRGGYGAMRLIEGIDINIIKKYPKIFLGYSDITTLLVYFSQQAGMVTYHGPMVGTDMHSGFTKFSRVNLFSLLMEKNKSDNLLPLLSSQHIKILCKGNGSGLLTGGNLTLIASSLSTPFEIDTRHKILFLEDIHVAPYEVDRMLTQLKLAGKLAGCAGFLLGSFSVSETDEKVLDDIFTDILGAYGKPVWSHMPFGHITEQITLPLGLPVAMDEKNKALVML